MSKARNLGELLDANGDVLANHLDHQSTSASDLTSGTLPAARLEALTLVAATQAESDNSTKVATTAYVTGKITTLIGGAPSTLNDLNELAAAINDDASYHSTLTTALATKLPLAGGAMTGNIVMADDTSIGISDSAERIEFDGAGDINILGANLGIGTTAPTNLLHIDGAAGNTFKQFTNNTTGHASGDGVIIGLAQDDSMLRIENRENAHIRFNTNNAERMRILNDGKIGIGTASPSQRLHVKSSGYGSWPVYVERSANSAQLAGIYESSSGDGGHGMLYIKDGSGNTDVKLSTNGDSWLNGGKIGIGTQAPAGTMHIRTGDAGVVTPSAQADDLVVENSAEGGITIMTPDTSSARIRFTSPSTESGDVGGACIFYRQNINKMNVGTQVSGGVLQLQSGAGGETMTLTGAGNVGIGTSSPDTALNVAGYIRGEAGSTPKLQLKRTGNAAGNGYIECLGSDDSVDYKIAFAQTAGTMSFSTAAANAMNIDSGGSVGIGTTSPSHLLDVIGDSKATRLIGRGVIENSSGVSGDTWAVMGLNTSNSSGSGGAVFGSKHADSNALLVGTHDATFNSFVVKGSGKVGIGLTAPLRALHVKSGAGTAQIQSTASTSTLYFADSGSSSIDNQGVGSANNDITLIAGGYERMRIASSGKVGIGISPAGMLHVDGHTSSIPSIFEGNGNGDSVAIQLKVKANNNSTSTQGLYGAAGSASTDNYITLGNSGTSGVTVNNSGKVGIGTTAPTSLLNISGAEPVVKIINTTNSATVSTSKRQILNNASSSKTLITDLLFSWNQTTADSWILVRTPQAYAAAEAGGWADFKLCWSGYHASNTTMKSWTAAFHNNHSRVFSWSKTGITTVGGGSGSYGPYNYSPAVAFYRQSQSAHGYTNSDAWMRNLFIKVSGNAASNVCSTRSLYITGMSGGYEYEVFHMGTSTPGGSIIGV